MAIIVHTEVTFMIQFNCAAFHGFPQLVCHASTHLLMRYYEICTPVPMMTQIMFWGENWVISLGRASVAWFQHLYLLFILQEDSEWWDHLIKCLAELQCVLSAKGTLRDSSPTEATSEASVVTLALIARLIGSRKISAVMLLWLTWYE